MSDNELEQIKNDLVSLKIRIRRIEDFIESMPNAKDYLNFGDENYDDDLLPEAIEVINQYDRASASLLQRRLSIGYARAARIIDQLEAKGYVESGNGSEPRKVLKKQL